MRGQAKGRLEGCEIWGNAREGGVRVEDGGRPTLAGCTIRDHDGRGVFVNRFTAGAVTVEADCVFARNAGGNIVGPTRGGWAAGGRGGGGRRGYCGSALRSHFFHAPLNKGMSFLYLLISSYFALMYSI